MNYLEVRLYVTGESDTIEVSTVTSNSLLDVIIQWCEDHNLLVGGSITVRELSESEEV